ncbi:hypothetical protein F0562_033095 [Nyssa sinensis]|uniref:Leucine-rich repeat-containing N-terminal plant-type domain-containing protein n=1 Tax=Nyssa sinensis TaxID=561372 RepID=A0A5J5AUH3_9ASTE|nr:hypothetical protein F0562_033095 [Nyssa sinensis]
MKTVNVYRYARFLSSFLCLIFSILSRYCRGCLEEERAALLLIKESINSPEGSAFSNWYGKDCCQWEGVECSTSTSTVIKLSLYYKKDRGLPGPWYPNATWFAQFKDLQELLLQGNHIGGFISPTAFRGLRHLQKLDLGGNNIEDGSHLCWGKMYSLHVLRLRSNNLQGQFPKCLYELHSLKVLDLSRNRLEGNIDVCLSNMSSLKHLDISGNQLNGSFPSLLFCNLTSIEYFFASDNLFNGAISFSMFANLSKLSHLDISFNDLEVQTESPTWFPSFDLKELFLGGCSLNKHGGNEIPSFISTQYHLQSLDLSYNSLVGSIPPCWFNVTSELWLGGNNMSGLFPWSLGNTSSNLSLLDISDNLFYGPIPADINIILPKLYHFNASFNGFEGVVPPIGEMSLLGILDLSSNRLHGEIPTSASGNNMSSLEYLKLSNNNLQGKMLPGNSSMPNLKRLYLHGNNFTEMNPHSLSKCSSLRILDVGENSLSGELCTQLPLLPRLMFLSLRKNHLEGRIPEQLCQMKYLRVLDLSHNNLSDVIPSCVDNFTSMKEETPRDSLEADSWDSVNFYLFSFGGEMLNYLTGIDVSCNRLMGTIPIQLGELGSIRIVNMSHNLLTGSIPTSFKDLQLLEALDLSHNKLFGEIPTGMVDLTFLADFSVAFNNLSGTIPMKAQFSTFDNSSYMGNPGLCGPPLEIRDCSSKIPASTQESGTTAVLAIRYIILPFICCLILNIILWC